MFLGLISVVFTEYFLTVDPMPKADECFQDLIGISGCSAPRLQQGPVKRWKKTCSQKKKKPVLKIGTRENEKHFAIAVEFDESFRAGKNMEQLKCSQKFKGEKIFFRAPGIYRKHLNILKCIMLLRALPVFIVLPCLGVVSPKSCTACLRAQIHPLMLTVHFHYRVGPRKVLINNCTDFHLFDHLCAALVHHPSKRLILQSVFIYWSKTWAFNVTFVKRVSCDVLLERGKTLL